MCHFLRDNLEMRDFKQGVLVGGQSEINMYFRKKKKRVHN